MFDSQDRRASVFSVTRVFANTFLKKLSLWKLSGNQTSSRISKLL